MIRRLLLVLQSISLIPPIGLFIYILIGIYILDDTFDLLFIFLFFLLSFIPFILLILGKYIVYGKFYIFKEKEEEQ